MFFKTQNNVPDVYTTESRDFQLLEKICDVTFNTTLSNLSKVQFIRYVETIDAALLKPLASYLGFFTEQYYPEELLRSILANFRDMIKNKGTLKSIEIATNALQSAYKGVSDVRIDTATDDPYEIIVISDGVVIDSSYVDEVMKYIAPVGVKIVQSYSSAMTNTSQIEPATVSYFALNEDTKTYEPVENIVQTVKKVKRSTSTITSIK